jgi:HEAT repeat protein
LKEEIAKLLKAKDVEKLVALLQAERRGTRIQAIRALGELRKLSTVQPLVEAMGDEEMLVRQAAAGALVEIGERAIPALVETLKGPGGRITPHALWALGEIGSPDAIDAVVKAAESRSWRIRWCAVESLGDLGGKRAIATLVRALGDRDERVRNAAYLALQKIGKPAVASLRTALRHPDKQVRPQAAKLLESIGSPSAQSALRRQQIMFWAPVVLLAAGLLLVLLWIISVVAM